MTSNNLSPIDVLARKAGCKILIYGGPGTGKTPALITSWSPCICEVETGLLSIKDWKGPGIICHTTKAIEEYIKWACESKEGANYTHCLDSISQAAKIFLEEKKNTEKHGLKLYGLMADWTSDLLSRIDKSERFWVITAKEEETRNEFGYNTRPSFPGQVLLIETPHLFDCVFRVEYSQYNGSYYRVFRTRDEMGTHKVRARSNKLDALEPADIQHVMGKFMS